MKLTSVVILAVVPFMFGCASTTTKTFSADFKVYPVETKDVGKTITTTEGERITIGQQYQFESVLTETTLSPDGDISSRDYKMSATTEIGHDFQVATACDGNTNQFAGIIKDLGTEYQADLKATISMNGNKPVSCAQTITIKK